VRLVRTEGGRLAIGRDRPGRGAWLCRGSEECLETAIRRKAFDRALRCRVGDDEVGEVRTALAGGLDAVPEEAPASKGPAS
jgi:predicted RNA-binding protein YlxR (DUF448 family)